MELSRKEIDTSEKGRTATGGDGVETIKHRGKGAAFGILGRVAEHSNRNEQASRFYELAAGHRASLDHVHESAEMYKQAGRLAAERGDQNAAAQHYEQAVDVLNQTQNPEALLRAIDAAIDARYENGDFETAMRWCEGGLSVAGDATISDAEDARTHFQLRFADVSDPEGGTPRTYDLALRNVLQADEATARYLLRNA
ncbi:hypothetical protein [Haladaptatus sp. NG-SE-30]